MIAPPPAAAVHAAPVTRVAWGMETWRCGAPQMFDLRLGSGGDVEVTRIEGTATLTLQAASRPEARWARAALISILPAAPAPGPPAAGAALASRTLAQPAVSNHSVAVHIGNVVVKQHGTDAAAPVPVAFAMEPPANLPGGRLRAVIDNQVYIGTNDAAADVAAGRTRPEECGDVELQLAVSFRERGR